MKQPLSIAFILRCVRATSQHLVMAPFGSESELRRWLDELPKSERDLEVWDRAKGRRGGGVLILEHDPIDRNCIRAFLRDLKGFESETNLELPRRTRLDLLARGLIDWSWTDVDRQKVFLLSNASGIRFLTKDVIPTIPYPTFHFLDNLLHCSNEEECEVDQVEDDEQSDDVDDLYKGFETGCDTDSGEDSDAYKPSYIDKW